MEYLGVIAFILVMTHLGLPGKIEKLKSEINKIKKAKKGESKMSEILRELQGKKCMLTLKESYTGPIECEVLSVDDEWMKIIQFEKKNGNKTKIIRIENIEEASLVE